MVPHRFFPRFATAWLVPSSSRHLFLQLRVAQASVLLLFLATPVLLGARHVAPELTLVTDARSLYNCGSSQARQLEVFNILPSQQSASSTSNTRGWAKRLFPPTALPTVLSQFAFQGSGRSPCEYGSSGSVPDSSSVGNQGSPDRAVGPICVDRVVVSARESH